MTIKAIQTEYKGYKFRSRLEARWAVFFDALGVGWEYEPEGFDLPSGLKYLPDFRLTNLEGNDLYVEIKRKNAFEPKLKIPWVYLAGKVQPGEDDNVWASQWRKRISHTELDSLNKYPFTFEGQDPSNFRAGYNYVGPHFEDNHGCYYVHERSFHQIERANIFFAWIDSLDAFGTFAEIGYAHRKSMSDPSFKVYVAFDRSIYSKDLWFLEECGTSGSGVFDDAGEAWEALVEKSFYEDVDEQKVSELSWSNDVLLLMGDPLDCQFYLYTRKYRYGLGINPLARMLGKGDDLTSVHMAATKARSARFEHGEKP